LKGLVVGVGVDITDRELVYIVVHTIKQSVIISGVVAGDANVFRIGSPIQTLRFFVKNIGKDVPIRDLDLVKGYIAILMERQKVGILFVVFFIFLQIRLLVLQMRDILTRIHNRDILNLSKPVSDKTHKGCPWNRVLVGHKTYTIIKSVETDLERNIEDRKDTDAVIRILGLMKDV
jgi:hypothetical protein